MERINWGLLGGCLGWRDLSSRNVSKSRGRRACRPETGRPDSLRPLV